MATNDPYEILGVARSASADEIKRAYRSLARQHHPDANQGDPEAAERFKEISLAYEILSDPDKRRRYDEFGSTGGPGGFGPTMDGFGIQDIFEAFFGGDPFGGGGGTRRGGPPRGQDAEAVVEVELADSAVGVTASVEVRMPVACEHCNGNGAEPGSFPSRCETCGGAGEVRQVRRSILGQLVTTAPCHVCQGAGFTIANPCTTCRGDGRVVANRTLELEVPAGIDDGQRLRLNGRGPAGFRGGPPGDLFVTVRVNPDPRFERHGDDLLHVRPIAFTQAALGAVLQIETFDGVEELPIPPGTQPGRMFRLKGQGMPHLRSRGRGDLLVRIDVEVPTKLDPEDEETLRAFAARRGEDVAPRDQGLFSRIKSAFQ